MSDDKQPKIELSVSVSADPAKAGLAEINAALKRTGETGAKAGAEASQQLEKLGATAKNSANKIQTALDTVERASVAATSGGSSTPDSLATRFRQRKIDAESLTKSLSEYTTTLANVKKQEANQASLNQIERASAAVATGGKGTAPELLALNAKQAGADMTAVNARLATYTQQLTVAKARVDELSASLKKQEATQASLNQIERASLIGKAAGGDGKSADLLALHAKQAGADMTVVNAALGKYSAEMLSAKKATEAAALASLELNRGVLGSFTTVKGLNAALRQVPSQLTDIVISLQGGQAPLTVLLQQGGQLKDVFGGIVPAAKALGGYILGLVNPYTLLAAAVAGVAVTYYKAATQVEAFTNALILSGRPVALNASQLEDVAFSLSKLSKVSLGTSAAALAEFVAAGRFGGANIQKLTQAAIELEKRGGPAIKETKNQFLELAREPLAASLKLNESVNYLTRSLADQIRAHEENGRAVKAGKLAQTAYADAILSRTGEIKENLGTYRKLWERIKEAIDASTASAIKAMDDFGKNRGPEQRIAELQRMKAGAHIGTSTADIDAEIEQQREILALNKKGEAASIAIANAKNSEAKATERLNKWKDANIKYESEELRLKRELNLKIGENNKLVEDGIITREMATKSENAIRAKFSKPGQDNALDKAKAAFEIGELQRTLAAEVDAYAQQGKVIDDQHKAGLISEESYYAAKRLLLTNFGITERRVLEEERAIEQSRVAFGKTRTEREIAAYDARSKDAAIRDKIVRGEQGRDAEGERLTRAKSAAEKERENTINAAKEAAQDYYDTVERGQRREIEGLGHGDVIRNKLAKENAIEDKFAEERKQIERARILDPKSNEPEQKAKYDALLQNNKEYLSKVLAQFREHYADLRREESDWVKGALRAIEQYQDGTRNTAKASEEFFTSAFKNMEDSLVNFVTTGRLSFSNLADYVVAQIARIIIAQKLASAGDWLKGAIAGGGSSDGFVGTAFNFVGGLLTGTNAANLGGSAAFSSQINGFFADGGEARAGGLYQVNERGPELLTTGGNTYLMMGAQDGTVTPNSAIGGNTVHVTINQSFGAGTSRATTLQAAADASRQLTAAGRNL